MKKMISAALMMLVSTLPVQATDTVENITDNSSLKSHNIEIRGQRGEFGVRSDLEPMILSLSQGKPLLREQLILFSRALDQFMTATSNDAAYDSYLVMTATKYCTVGLGYGSAEMNDLFLQLSKSQIDTNLRRIANIKSEQLISTLSLPELHVFDNLADYCVYTSKLVNEG